MGKYIPKQSGTSESSFQINAASKPFTLDASALTSSQIWVIPDSSGSSGYILSTDGTGILSWVSNSAGSPNLDGGTANSIYGGGPLINGGGA